MRSTWRRSSSDKGRSLVVRKVRELKVSKTSLLSYEGLGATSPWEDQGRRESYSILLSTAAGGSMRRPPGATPELAVGALEPEADHQCRKQEVTGLCCWGHGEDVLVGSSEPWSPPFFLPSSSAVCHQNLQHRWKSSVTPMGSETFPSLRLSSGMAQRHRLLASESRQH